MNFLKNSIKETAQTITKHKKFFILLLILQIFVFTLFAIVTFNYAIKIISNLETLTNPTLNQDITQNTEQQLQNALHLTNQFTQIIDNLISMSITLTLIYLLGNGLLWSLSHELITQNNNKIQWKTFLKNLSQQWLKFITTTLLIITPFVILVYYSITYSINQSIPPETFSTLLKTLISVKIFLYFIILITYAYICEPSWKKYLQQIITSFKKIHYILLTTAINLLLLTSTIYVIYLTITIPQLETLSIILTFLFIILLTITRLFWIVSLKNITLTLPNQKP